MKFWLRTTDACAVENVGGYRLVRKLGEGSRAEVWLGHPARDATEASSAAVTAVKLYRPHVALHSIDGEIEALARVSSAHLVELLDIASASDGRPCLVLARLPHGTLEQLFATRDSFSAGELVTALAPVAAAVAELHRLGIVHGAIGASAVLLDGRRAPVLACFGASRLVGDAPIDDETQSLTPAQHSVDEGIAGDVGAVAALVRSFAGRVDSPVCESLVDWLGSQSPDRETLAELTDRLFDLAPATPLDATDRHFRPSPASSRLVVGRTGPPAEPAPDPADEKAIVGWWQGLLPWVVAHVSQDPVSAVVVRLKATAATVRRPVWIVAGFGLAALVIGLAVIPAAGSTVQSGATAPPVGPTGTAGPGLSPTQLPVRSSAGSSAVAALAADDPLDAARALVAARASCIRQRSVGCLDTVDQTGSAALEADRYFVRQQQGGSTVPDRKLDASIATLVQRLGDSALIGLGSPSAPATYPASILIVKVEAGWRIRDLTTGITP